MVIGLCAFGGSQDLAKPREGFGKDLALAMTLERPIPAGDSILVADFVLTNAGDASFDGCFGEEWGVVLILEDGRDAGHSEMIDHPSCVKRFVLEPHRTLEWSREVSLTNIAPGRAKLKGWLKVVDPNACDRMYGCYDASLSSKMEVIEVGRQ